MALRIQVSPPEFNAACSDGWVDGLLQGKRGLFVYVELGQEQEYMPNIKDDPKTRYKMFRGCSAFFAKSQQQLENGDYEAGNLQNVTVIIYF